MTLVYLDYNATTPVDGRVLEALLPYYVDRFANASSIDHLPGSEARRGVEHAREQVAALIRAQPEEIIFTSGATESNNIAITGTMRRAPDDAEVIVSAVEHPAVLEPARQFANRVRIVPVDDQGVVDPEEVRRAITSRTALVSVMAANNETGAVQPLAAIGEICADAGVAFHIDGVQAAARMRIDVDAVRATTLALSAHKMYGPKGVGALFVRRRRPRAQITPVSHGGGQERNLRPGTLNVPGIVGLGEAASLVLVQGTNDWSREQFMRDALLAELHAKVPVSVVPNSPLLTCLPQTLNVRLVGISASATLRAISTRVAISTGSACSTISVEPSHVLLAQGLTRNQVGESLRISFGRQTTHEELAEFVSILVPAVEALLSVSVSDPAGSVVA